MGRRDNSKGSPSRGKGGKGGKRGAKPQGGKDADKAQPAAGPKPLQHQWCFHGSTVDKSKTYEENQRLVGSFDTVEGFWRMWRAMATPSQLFRTAAQLDAVRGIEPPPAPHTVESICLFKQGIQPTWEDSANAGGGQWNGKHAVAVNPHREAAAQRAGGRYK